jgi:hypothetical protein
LFRGENFVGTGVRLGDDEQRRAFAAKVREAEPERRAGFTRDLEATLRNLARLLQEIEGDDG